MTSGYQTKAGRFYLTSVRADEIHQPPRDEAEGWPQFPPHKAASKDDHSNQLFQNQDGQKRK